MDIYETLRRTEEAAKQIEAELRPMFDQARRDNLPEQHQPTLDCLTKQLDFLNLEPEILESMANEIKNHFTSAAMNRFSINGIIIRRMAYEGTLRHRDSSSQPKLEEQTNERKMTRFLHNETIIAWGAAAYLWLIGIPLTLYAKAATESTKSNQVTNDILMDGYFMLAAATILTGLIGWQTIQTRRRRNRGADRTRPDHKTP